MKTTKPPRPRTIDPGDLGGIIVVDKPAGITSHDVVAAIRRLAGTRRVGHAGTLDPMATGVLVIGVEKATRLLGHLMLTEKAYDATIRLGQATTTDDAEGEPLSADVSAAVLARGDDPPYPPRGPIPSREGIHVSAETLAAEVAKLTGEILQVPPAVSAIKVNGERAYKLTRAGAAPEMKPRPVTVYEFTVTRIAQAGDFTDVDATIRCSSGTYIRALARDLGSALGAGGHLTALRRTRVGPYDIGQAHRLEDLQNPEYSSERIVVTPIATAAAAAFPKVDLTAGDARRLEQGARLPAVPGVSATADHPAAAFAPDGTFVALVAEESGKLRSLAVFSVAK